MAACKRQGQTPVSLLHTYFMPWSGSTEPAAALPRPLSPSQSPPVVWPRESEAPRQCGGLGRGAEGRVEKQVGEWGQGAMRRVREQCYGLGSSVGRSGSRTSLTEQHSCRNERLDLEESSARAGSADPPSLSPPRLRFLPSDTTNLGGSCLLGQVLLQPLLASLHPSSFISVA